MTSQLLLVLSLALLAGIACAQVEGDPCVPRRPDRCGKATLINENSTEVDDMDSSANITGENVCEAVRTYVQRTYEYTYQRRCYRGWFGRRICSKSLQCRRDTCTGNNVTFTKTKLQCCEGFAEEESSFTTKSFNKIFRRFHRKGSSLSEIGCPVELVNNLTACLSSDSRLSNFLAEILEAPEILARLNDEDSKPVTVFAFRNSNIDLTVEEAAAVQSGAHIAIGEVKLFDGDFLPTLATNVNLHVDKVFTEGNATFFVNGVRITELNACRARNGRVHIVENVIPSSSDSITTILQDRQSFSRFNELLEAAEIAELLAVPSKSRTVFAPVNEAFDAVPGLRECLLDNEYFLSCFVLAHVTFDAEYASILSLQEKISAEFHGPLRFSVEGGVPTITTKLGAEVSIQEADISASNGVIHSINGILQPFSQRKLDKICPDMPDPTEPATNPPPAATTNPPVTVAPTIQVPENPEDPGIPQIDG